MVVIEPPNYEPAIATRARLVVVLYSPILIPYMHLGPCLIEPVAVTAPRVKQYLRHVLDDRSPGRPTPNRCSRQPPQSARPGQPGQTDIHKTSEQTLSGVSTAR